MTIAAGRRLGAYEILAPLGAGGMGEVYRARDSRLGREVAIKLLPEALASDRDRLSRFEQEARSASALNHPNIITIYEIGMADSISYISMELVQGRTLRDLILEGLPPARRLLALAAQIADALARAHEAGIVHRDLKPENVMVTREGVVKVLDFGLAKLTLPESAEISAMPTLAQPETQPGIVLGTIGYMSPEQASGKKVDFRSDQFSIGSILYEMAAGKRPFSRATAAETLAAIIRDEPEALDSSSPRVPVALRWVIERCLAKDPEERYASTRDLARDLAHLRDHVSEVSQAASAVVPRRRSRRRALLWSTGLLLASALGVLAGRKLRPDEPALRPARFTIPVPPGATYLPSEVSRAVTVSPDGTRVVIEAISRGRRRLYLRRLDSEEFAELEGSLDASAPFWSPDGRSLAFFAEGKLKKIPAAGGSPVELCDAPFATVGTWNREGTILFTKLSPQGIYRVSDRGGEAAIVRVPDAARKERGLSWPHFLPDGRRYLFLASSAPGAAATDLRLGSLDSKESRSLGSPGSRVEYAAPGYLLHVREGALFARPFDERKAQLEGDPQLLAANAHYFYGPNHAAFSVSQTGVLVYQVARASSRLVWFDRAGKDAGSLGQPSVVKGLRISPDGTRAAVDILERRWGTSDIWVFELGSGVATRLHSDPGDENMPLWSADGAKVFYRSDRTGPPDIFEMAIAVPGSEKPLLQAPGVQQPEDASRDGRLLAYLNEVQSTVWNIWLLPLAGGERKLLPWLPTRFNQTSPRFSPDGRWIAYESDESGDSEIYVALTEGGGEKRRLSPSGGKRPRWRRDGKELYYIAPGGFVMALTVTPGARPETGAPVPLFRVDSEIENYDAAADGSRFLLAMPAEKVRESPIRVILNWPAALEKEK
jgi:serine/threonine protein kinase/Tol biopolymer transport system component